MTWQDDFELYNSKKSEWLKEHRNEWVFIYQGELQGFFASQSEAMKRAEVVAGDDDFFVHQVVDREPTERVQRVFGLLARGSKEI